MREQIPTLENFFRHTYQIRALLRGSSKTLQKMLRNQCFLLLAYYNYE